MDKKFNDCYKHYHYFNRAVLKLKNRVRGYLKGKKEVSLDELREFAEKNNFSLEIQTRHHYMEDDFDVIEGYICQPTKMPKFKSKKEKMYYTVEHKPDINCDYWPEDEKYGLGYTLEGGILKKTWSFGQVFLLHPLFPIKNISSLRAIKKIRRVFFRIL